MLPSFEQILALSTLGALCKQDIKSPGIVGTNSSVEVSLAPPCVRFLFPQPTDVSLDMPLAFASETCMEVSRAPSRGSLKGHSEVPP